MKQKMKRVLGLVLAAALTVGVCSGCVKGGNEDENTVTYVVLATERSDTARIVEKMQKIILEKTGQQLEFEFVSDSAYDLVISSGDPVDLVFAPDYKNYWPNAGKGAFSEITDEDLKKHAPYIWENLQSVINVSKHKGKRYGVPNLRHYAPDRCIVARGDLMDKYGIKDLNSMENIEAYLTAVAENEPELIPFDINGNSPYALLAMFASDWGWSPVATTSFAEHVYYDADDPERKIFVAAERPEMLEFTKTMKRWNEKGFFSKSVLSNKTNILDSFKAGRSAIGLPNSPAECQMLWEEFQKDDRKGWDIRFFTRYQERQAMYNVMNGLVAVSKFTDNKEGALKVLNEFYANEELYKLLCYGIEGEHYVINEDGTYSVTEKDENRGYIATGIWNDNWNLETKLNFPGCEELVDKLYNMRVTNPAVNMALDDTNIREIKVALGEVYGRHTTPRYFGAFEGTAEEAIEKEVKALKAAGIDEYVAELQKQLDEYFKGIGE